MRKWSDVHKEGGGVQGVLKGCLGFESGPRNSIYFYFSRAPVRILLASIRLYTRPSATGPGASILRVPTIRGLAAG